MKILLDHPLPFLLAHGGFQIQIEQTMKALSEIGLDVEYLRWWDDTQRGDIIHYFGRLSGAYVGFAKSKGFKVVLGDLLTSQGSRTPLQRLPHWFLRQLDNLSGDRIASRLGWDAYRTADACVALTSWEAQLMGRMFGAPEERLRVVPNGVEQVFFAGDERGGDPSAAEFLICTATVTERKRVVELAEAAVLAKTPLWVLGKPYAENDPYYRRFLQIVEKSGGTIRYEGPVSDRARLASIYQGARGFVLLSTMESLSLSALEAAAGGCPLLLSDLPWARCTFGQSASYCPIAGSTVTAPVLRDFYGRAPQLPRPPRPKTWVEVARELQKIYAELLGR